MKKLFFVMLIFFFVISCENSTKKVTDDETGENLDNSEQTDEATDDETSDDEEVSEGYEIVDTQEGKVKGVSQDGVISYKGVPYAAPPVGDLRWEKPQSAQKRDEILEADTYSKACPQSLPVAAGYIPPWSEDCLYLNVFRPDSEAEDLPVMVFIHGGGFVNGAASLATYEGSWLASKGIVLVTINYRLGQFGFINIPDTEITGNYGIYDQIAALEWVRANISSFGGNSGNVTIFGESAGAMSVGSLIAVRPDLFEKAIIESGTILWGNTSMKKEDADDQGERFVEASGCKNEEDVVKCLKEKSAENILTYLESGIFSDAESYGPHVDGELFTDMPYRMAIAGDGKDVPLIIGTNLDEGTAFTYSYKDYIQTEEQYESIVTQQFGATAAPYVLEEYPASDYESPWHAYTDLFADVTFNCASVLLAREFSKHNENVRYYRFTHVPDYGVQSGLGCFHGAELGYLFNTWDDYYKNSEEGYVDTVDNISGLWLRFAQDGKLDEWPVYDDNENYLDLSENTEIKEKLEKDNCDFWAKWSQF